MKLGDRRWFTSNTSLCTGESVGAPSHHMGPPGMERKLNEWYSCAVVSFLHSFFASLLLAGKRGEKKKKENEKRVVESR